MDAFGRRTGQSRDLPTIDVDRLTVAADGCSGLGSCAAEVLAKVVTDPLSQPRT
jgi:hypothetical protein